MTVNMGTGICSRRQKGLLQTGFCLLAVACFAAGGLLYSHLQEKMKNAETLSFKYKQQQDALSAQLQVVYEHRSRLERSLQKERSEHKKTKEDFLVYKLEAQEALNKEKQDSMNRYGALSSQHKILKNQHEDLKKQLQDLQSEHNNLKLENRRIVETHNQKYNQLQTEKDNEVSNLQDSVFKLKEESKLLRKAHQDVHSQLLDAQSQIDEFRQLKNALQKMSGFKENKDKQIPSQFASQDNKQLQHTNPKIFAGSHLETLAKTGDQQKYAQGNPARTEDIVNGDGQLQGHASLSNIERKLQGNNLLGETAQIPDSTPHTVLPLWQQKSTGNSDGHSHGFTRTVNSLQNENVVQNSQVKKEFTAEASDRLSQKPQHPITDSHTTGKKMAYPQRWEDVVNKVNSRLDKDRENMSKNQQTVMLGMMQNKEIHHNDPLSLYQGKRLGLEFSKQKNENKEALDKEELEMDAGMIDREENPPHGKEHVAQEPMMPDGDGDPAQDPNNQGEDEFEEAELERPDFEERAAGADKIQEVNKALNEELREKMKEDHGGEVDDNEDPEVAQDELNRGHVDVAGAGGNKEEDY
ncbi:Golgi integral membrane protein 4-like isoform X2 [Protopterus annectens]|uniref:Golgi integral membrane protein 4-like isoform X2 n=1 Tax=Protopterus annectens TaxID=7888 RepID=UPI001CFB285B|nr:Golgi integral membrane protein 4-like isoform X2 [Protopterus annectens]